MSCYKKMFHWKCWFKAMRINVFKDLQISIRLPLLRMTVIYCTFLQQLKCSRFNKIILKRTIVMDSAPCLTTFKSISNTQNRENRIINLLKTENVKSMDMASRIEHGQFQRVAFHGSQNYKLYQRTNCSNLDRTKEKIKESLHKVMNLLEYCINIISDKEQHDGLWEHVIAARNEMEAIKQQLMDLKILFDYSCLTLENASMAAFISGANFSASVSQQLIISAKQEFEVERNKNVSLENQYVSVVADHVRALAGLQSQEVNDPIECKSQEHDTHKSDKPQGKQENNSEILNNDDAIQPGTNEEEQTIVEGFSQENLDVNEVDKKNTDNQNIYESEDISEEIMSKNTERNWMSGFSEYVEYKEEDEKVLSF
ncbi:unnamed protein product, partial [Meganyctiphanes norvegica]